MSVITPNSTIRILAHAPVDPTNQNFVMFESKQAQDNYMASLSILSREGCTYVNKLNDGTPVNQVRLSGSADNIIAYGGNVIMYLNNSWTDEPFWYYGFITNVQQVNKSTVAIDFEPAWLLTYFYSCKFGPSLIERAHVTKSNDQPGKFLEPEGLETGPFIVNEYHNFFNNGVFAKVNNNPCVVIACSLGRNKALDIVDDSNAVRARIAGIVNTFAGGTVFGGNYQGCNFIASNPILNLDGDVNWDNVKEINRFIETLVMNGTVDKIQSMFLVPELVVGGLGINRITDEIIADPDNFNYEAGSSYCAFGKDGRLSPGEDIPVYDLYDGTPTTGSYKLNNIDTLDGYTPRNKKLLTQDFNYLVLSTGTAMREYGFEFFWRGQSKYRTPTFGWFAGVNADGCTISIYPVGYNMTNDGKLTKFFDVDNGLTLDTWPQASYAYNKSLNNYRQNIDRTNYQYNRAYVELAGGAINKFISALTSALAFSTGVGAMGTEEMTNMYGWGQIGQAASGGGGLLTTGYDQTVGAMAKTEEFMRAPNIINGVNNASLRSMFQGRWVKDSGPSSAQQDAPAPLDFVYERMTITAEMAKTIDYFFDMYGYKLQVIANPSNYFSTRAKWNFVKTSNIMIKDHSGPREVFTQISEAFNKGITIWHNPSYWMDYSNPESNT